MAHYNFLFVLPALLLLANVQSSKLPSYLKACSVSDPNLNECAKKSGQAGIPLFINGDRKFKLPPLNPLEVTAIHVNQGNAQFGLKILLENCKFYGLEKTTIKDINIDIPNKQITWLLNTPSIDVLSNYNVSGRVLVLPIVGNGKANVTIVNPTYKYTWKFTVEKRKGQEYIVPKKGTITYKVDKLRIDLSNLFNGDKVLGPQMNRFLNENWAEAASELGSSLAEALSGVFDSIIQTICDAVPYNDIFKP